MAEEIDRGTTDRQATWVALRTLRQRPTLVGRTEDGAAVYDVRSVRLVLTPGSSHFKRLVSCAKCGRDVPGSPILSPADLDRPPNPVFCDRCAQSGPARPEVPRDREGPPEPPAVVAPPVVAQGAVDAGRLAAVEAQLAEVLSWVASPVENRELQRLSEQVADLLRGQNAELAKMAASVAQARAEMRELGESHRALAHAQRDLDQRTVELEAQAGADIETTLAAELADVRESLAAMIDARAQPLHAALAQMQDDFARTLQALAEQVESSPGADIETTLAAELADVRESLAAMIDARAQPLHAALAQMQDDFARTLQALAGQVESSPGADIETALAAELADVRASLTATIDATAQALRAALVDGLDHLRSEVASLQQRVDDEAAARLGMSELAESNRALARTQGDLDQRLGDLAAQVAALPRPNPEAVGAQELAELRAIVTGAVGAVESLDQRSRDELAAVAALLEAQRKDLTEALHDVAHETLMSMADPLRDLAKARDDIERRLESLQIKAQEDQRRVEALNASATAGASRLHTLEQKLHTSVQRLIHPVAATRDQGEVGPAPAVGRRPAGALLESLERQLRDAEERLGQL